MARGSPCGVWHCCADTGQVFWSMLERFDECTDSVEQHRKDVVARLGKEGIILHRSAAQSAMLAAGSGSPPASSVGGGSARDDGQAALALSQAADRVEGLQAALRTAQARARKVQEENRRLRQQMGDDVRCGVAAGRARHTQLTLHAV